MIVAFSTSCHLAGVALLDENGAVIGASTSEASMAASGACLKLLAELLTRHGSNLGEASLFAADLGPGSFTGVKVGVTLAKVLGLACGVAVAGAESFDLIDPRKTVVMPSKRGEFFVRRVGSPPFRSRELPSEPFVGFGPGITEPVYPSAERFAGLLPSLQRMRPEHLLPHHMLEPSISQPKKPFAQRGPGAQAGC